MEIGKLNITAEIDGRACIIVLKDFDESKKNFLLKTIIGLNGDENLKAIKLNKDFKFVNLKEAYTE